MDHRIYIYLLLGFLVLRIVEYLYRSRKVHQQHGASPLGYEDASGQNLAPPPKLVPLIEEAGRLGFTRLGEVQTTGAVYNPPLRAWVLADSSRRTVCDLFLQLNPDMPAIGGFATVFKDGWVTTTYQAPRPYMLREVNDPDFRARDVSESLSAAYQAHRQDVAEMRTAQGVPVECNTIQDYLGRERLYIEKYYPRRTTSRKLTNEVAAVRVILLADFVVSAALLIAALVIPRSPTTTVLVMSALGVQLVAAPLANYFLRRFLGEERLARSG